MGKIAAAWAAMSSAARAVAIGGLTLPLILVVTVAAVAVGAAPAPSVKPGPTPPPVAALPTDAPLSPSPSPLALPSVGPSASASAQPSAAATADPLLGTDGRLTVLLLGSDYRPAHPGNRTDAMMVVSVDPTTGRSGAFSVPRDIVDFPLPGRGSLRGRVNGLYQYLQATDEPWRREHDGGLRARLRHRDRQLRLHRLQRRPGAGQCRRWRRCPAAEGLLRPLLLGEQPHARLGPAGRQEPSQRPAGPDLRPQPEGRQRLRSRTPPAAARDGRVRQGAQARPGRSPEAPQGRARTASGPTCRCRGRTTCSSSIARSTSRRPSGPSSGRRPSRSGRTGTPTTWSSPSARRGSRRTSRRSGHTGRGRRRPRRRVPSRPARLRQHPCRASRRRSATEREPLPRLDRIENAERGTCSAFAVERRSTRTCRRAPGWRWCASRRPWSGRDAGRSGSCCCRRSGTRCPTPSRT